MTLIDLLRAAADAEPDQPFVITPNGETTYAECLATSEAIARGLADEGVDRFACAVHDARATVSMLCASSAVGSEACVYPLSATHAELAELARAMSHRVVVSDTPVDVPGITWVAPESLARPAADPIERAPQSPTLILTTGTTGRPKAARHDWARLLAAVRVNEDLAGKRWLLAYNLNQFAGVQVLLHVLKSRGTLVVPASNRPREALVAMRELAVTHASATPTFWRLLTGMLDAEAAAGLALEQITLGGEAVPAALLADLRALFPAASISQIYASTELGSTVSVSDARDGLPASVLERGDDATVQFRIIDGELHARSRVGMLGYEGEGDTEGEWLPTGDMVEVRGDRIHFVGRRSDIINVGGVKVHPLPVEQVVNAVHGVRLCRVRGRPNPVSGNIVVVDVMVDADADRDAVEERIRTACRALPPALQPRRVHFVDDLELRENKLVRQPVAGDP